MSRPVDMGYESLINLMLKDLFKLLVACVAEPAETISRVGCSCIRLSVCLSKINKMSSWDLLKMRWIFFCFQICSGDSRACVYRGDVEAGLLCPARCLLRYTRTCQSEPCAEISDYSYTPAQRCWHIFQNATKHTVILLVLCY